MNPGMAARRNFRLWRMARAARRCCPVIAGVTLWLGFAGISHAQTAGEPASGAINLGGRGLVASQGPLPPVQDRPDSPFQFSFRSGFATDYIYRGTTLSAHQPVVGAAFEVSTSILYGAGTIVSVKLPSQPIAELSAAAGVRPKVGNVQFDFGATYFAYPTKTPLGEPVPTIDYWEAVGRADTTLGDVLRVAGGFGYAPNVSNTGAWSKYAAFGVGVDLPGGRLPLGLSASITGGAGYFWFGDQSPDLGGFPLPAYTNWNVGITFTRKLPTPDLNTSLNLDLRYYDTNLSRENCYVFTGDPNAAPGGRPNPFTNPEGLTSSWCSATFVAKFSFAFN